MGSNTEAPLYRHPAVDPTWLGQVVEKIIDPGRPIVDPHHHLWSRDDQVYLLPEFQADLGTGHNVVATVYLQCHWAYRENGPETLRPVGETAWVRDATAAGNQPGSARRPCAGIVGFADLALGDGVEEVLTAHLEAGGGRFRGIRQTTAREETFRASVAPVPPAGLMLSDAFCCGIARLGKLGLSFDAWLFHTQLDELVELAARFPAQPIVINHIGGRLAIGRYADEREAVFQDWLHGLRALAAFPQVYIKIGGLGMLLAGYGFHERASPPTSQELATAWGPTVEACVAAFGAERCMFESNFPVDKAMFAYPVLWNAFKRLAASYSAAEQAALFHDTAARFYRLGL